MRLADSRFSRESVAYVSAPFDPCMLINDWSWKYRRCLWQLLRSIAIGLKEFTKTRLLLVKWDRNPRLKKTDGC